MLEARCGCEALRLASERQPQVAIIDVRLPDVDGIEVCRRIKSDPKTRSIRVLNISAVAITQDEKATGLESGADSYLTEPVLPDLLVASVRTLLRSWVEENLMRRRLEAARRAGQWHIRRSWLESYGFAAAAVVAAFALRTALDPVLHTRSPLLLFAFAVTVAAAFGGFGPGLFATALGSLLSSFFFMEPSYSFRVTGLADYVLLGVFAAMGVLVSGLAEKLHRANREINTAKKRLELSQEAARIGTFEWSVPDDRIVWTEELERLYGLKQGAFEGNYAAWKMRVVPDDAAVVESAIQEAFEYQKPTCEFEFRVYLPDGSLRWLCGKARLSFDAVGRPQRMLGINMDVTERKAAEVASRQHQERLALAQRAGRIGIFDYDLQSDRAVLTPEMEGLVGIEAGSFSGGLSEWSKYIHPDDSERTRRSFNEAIAQRRAEFEIDYRIIREDGGIRWLRTVSEFFYEEGRAIRQIGVNIDVTERKQIEEALRQANEEYRIMGESIPYGAWRCDPEGGVEYLSHSFLDLLGMTIEQAKGFGWTSRLPKEDVDPTLNRWFECVRTGHPWEEEYRICGSDGQVHHVLSKGLPVRDAEGRIASWVGINLNIDRRKSAEEKLALNRQRLELAQTSAGIGIYDWDMETGEVVWAGEMESIFGLAQNTFEGTFEAWAKRVLPEDLQKLQEVGREWLERSYGGTYEYRILRTDGEVRWIQGSAAVIHDASGRPRRLIGVNFDITEKKCNEERLRQQTAELEAALSRLQESEWRLQNANLLLQRSNEELQQFAYAVSHDLQEPLRTVGAFSELLLRKHRGKDPQTDEYGGHINTGIKRMSALIRDLLEYSRITHEDRKAEASVSVGEIVSEVISSLQAAIGETGARIHIDPLPSIVADRRLLVQLFQNLVANAIKYRGDNTPEISISANETDTGWRFCVRDNGIGIDMRYAEQIFGVFRRLHARDQYSGTGIGLAICKRIVERHGGRIWVESQPGKGSAFYFTLASDEDGGELTAAAH